MVAWDWRSARSERRVSEVRDLTVVDRRVRRRMAVATAEIGGGKIAILDSVFRRLGVT